MENLTNEQIVDIINFYKLCGVTEDMYLSSDGVLDLFTLLGIKPEYDENGNRLPTVYEQLEIAPKFHDGKEVPIIFAIKHKANHVIRRVSSNFCTEFSYQGKSKKAKDKTILNQLRKDYFSAISSGNMNEATRLYDMIDMMTGGKADYFIAVQYNCVKFYKKMQKQLLIDMFANFVILMILSKKTTVKNGIVKFDKFYKAFVEKQLSSGGFAGMGISAPKLSNITVSLSGDESDQKLTVKTSVNKKGVKVEEKTVQEIKIPEENNRGDIISYVKSKINVKLNHLKDKLTRKQVEENETPEENSVKSNFDKQEKLSKVLEND